MVGLLLGYTPTFLSLPVYVISLLPGYVVLHGNATIAADLTNAIDPEEAGRLIAALPSTSSSPLSSTATSGAVETC
jgi:hypothetical protein